MAYMDGPPRGQGDEVWRLWLRPTASDIIAHEGHDEVTDELLLVARTLEAMGFGHAQYSLSSDFDTQWTYLASDGTNGWTDYIHMQYDGTLL